MADKSLLDQALAMVPGMSVKKKTQPRPSPKKQLELIQKSLAVLARDAEKLAALVAGKSDSAKKTAAQPRKPRQSPKAARTTRKAKTTDK